jgi:TrmH family RNA methyltransferase
MITSSGNSRIKEMRALVARRKARHGTGRCVLEGARLVGDAWEAGTAPFEYALFTGDFAASAPGAALLTGLDAGGVPCFEIDPALAGDVAGTETPPGVWAVCRFPKLPTPAAPTLALVIDQVSDPGNLGTIIRTAAAAGVDLVALTKGTVDPFNPKTLRAGMGAHFRVPVVFAAWDALPPVLLVLADAAGATRYDAFDWTQPVALVVGSEAHGFSGEAKRRAAEVVCIPMARRTESLNAAAAAAVILFEARRQRL